MSSIRTTGRGRLIALGGTAVLTGVLLIPGAATDADVDLGGALHEAFLIEHRADMGADQAITDASWADKLHDAFVVDHRADMTSTG